MNAGVFSPPIHSTPRHSLYFLVRGYVDYVRIDFVGHTFRRYSYTQYMRTAWSYNIEAANLSNKQKKCDVYLLLTCCLRSRPPVWQPEGAFNHLMSRVLNSWKSKLLHNRSVHSSSCHHSPLNCFKQGSRTHTGTLIYIYIYKYTSWGATVLASLSINPW